MEESVFYSFFFFQRGLGKVYLALIMEPKSGILLELVV